MSDVEAYRFVPTAELFGEMRYEQIPRNPRVMFGRHKIGIDEASNEWRKRFFDEFGVFPTATIAQKNYGKTRAQAYGDYLLAKAAFEHAAGKGIELGDDIDKLDPIYVIADESELIRKAVFRQKMPKDMDSAVVVPSLVSDHLIDVSGSRTNIFPNFGNSDCVFKSLLTYAPALQEYTNLRIDCNLVRRSLMERGFPGHAKHDLYSLLYSLKGVRSNDLAVDVRMTVGMGLDEIAERLIGPMIDKKPTLRFGISLLTASEKLRWGNHSYVLTGGDSAGYPRVYDYSPNVEVGVSYLDGLARRWFLAGMQAGIVIVNGLGE